MANFLRDLFIKKQALKVAPAVYPAPHPSPQQQGRRSFLNNQIEEKLNWSGRAIISPNQDILNEGKQVRASARTLFQQSPHTCKYLDFLSNQVLGPGGVALRATVKTNSGELHARINQKVMDGWKDFSRKQNLCLNGEHTLLGACSEILKTTALDGEVFVRLVKQGKYGLQIEMIDADLLDDQLNGNYSPTGNKVVMGIEVDKGNKPVAYHFSTDHPSEGGKGSKTIRVPAAEVIHIKKTTHQGTRMNSIRAASWFAPVFQHIKMLDEYMRYESTAALISSATLAFIEQEAAAVLPEEEQEVGPNKPKKETPVSNVALEPGTIQFLNPGQKMNQFDAAHPTANFESFVKTTLKGISTGLPAGLFFILAQSVDDVNFAAGRFGMDDTRDSLKSLQTWFIDSFLEPLFVAWSKTNATQSYTSVRNLDTLDWEWTSRGWDYMQPVDAATADAMNLKNGLTSLERIYRNKGLDWKVEVEQIAEERKYLQQLGLSFESITPLAAAPVEAEPVKEAKQEAVAPDAEAAEPVQEKTTQDPKALIKD